MKKYLILIFLVLAFSYAAADVDNSVLEVMNGRYVVVEKVDGSEVAGKLMGFDPLKLTVMKKDGRIVTVYRSDIMQLKGDAASIRQNVAKTPIGQTEFEINILGLLQFGPIFSYDLKIADDIMVGGHLRLQGIGVLYQLIASKAFEDFAAPWSFALGFQMKYLFPNTLSNNRMFMGFFADFGLGWTSGDFDTSWEWKGNHGNLVIALQYGYRWRYASGFYLNVGIMAGYCFLVWDNWYYLTTPNQYEASTNPSVFFGMLEFSLGWEKK